MKDAPCTPLRGLYAGSGVASRTTDGQNEIRVETLLSTARDPAEANHWGRAEMCRRWPPGDGWTHHVKLDLVPRDQVARALRAYPTPPKADATAAAS